MPVTFVTFGLGYLALIGFPFLSGYYSKDAIIEAAFGQEGWRGWVFGGAAMLGVALTAFYMTRLMLMTFFGKQRWKDLRSSEGEEFHPHEAPAVMTIPMIVLAIGSVGAGFFFTSDNRIARWLEPSLGELRETGHGPIPQLWLTVLSVGLMVVGAGLAWLFVGRKPVPVTKPEKVSWVVRAARYDLYGNALNEALFANPGAALTRALVTADDKGVDGTVTGVAGLLGFLSSWLRRTQTGFVRSYALTMLGGSVLVVAALLMVRFA
ncbi:MAG: NADH-quinone oxidoreductase subunit L, partial [Kutzneria sp.]|nr:NADH-quinone oxidoreductase subunit L [Kutzneria sp.]